MRGDGRVSVSDLGERGGRDERGASGAVEGGVEEGVETAGVVDGLFEPYHAITAIAVGSRCIGGGLIGGG